MNTYKVQCLLAYLGYMEEKKNGATVRYAIDGLSGPQTKGAISAFQKDYGLPVTDQADDKTQKALRDAVAYNKFKPPDAVPNSGTITGNGPMTTNDWEKAKYFRRDEPFIGCSCGKCGGFPVEPQKQLMRLAVKVREHFDAPMVPTSTVRCTAHNAAVGGAKGSRHERGLAMDYKLQGHSASEILAYLKQLPEVNYCYAVNDRVVHMDVD